MLFSSSSSSSLWVVMGIEKKFLLKRMSNFSEISKFWLLFVVIWKGKKNLGLIREYFNNSNDSTWNFEQVNLESQSSRLSLIGSWPSHTGPS